MSPGSLFREDQDGKERTSAYSRPIQTKMHIDIA
jgi:hypothetical protein